MRACEKTSLIFPYHKYEYYQGIMAIWPGCFSLALILRGNYMPSTCKSTFEVTMERKSGCPQDAGHLEGRYANYFEVGYNAFEFLLDFGQHYHGYNLAKTHTRIITSPGYAKALVETIQNSIAQFELKFGPIKENFAKTDEPSKF
jgi:hypothetical protein